MIKKEHIPSDPKQSFRVFSWEDSLVKPHLYQGDKSIVEVQGMGNEWHYHPEMELTLFTEGEGIRYIGDDVSFFKAPELVLLGSNLPHHWEVGRSSGYCIQFSNAPAAPFMGLYESSEFGALFDKSARGRVFSIRCAKEVQAMMESGLQGGSVERLIVILKILQRMNYAQTKAISKSAPQGLFGRKSEVVKKAVNFIVENATDESLSLKNVLDYVSMSRATFSRHFQQALGQSYTQFVQSIRMEKARNLVASTDKPMTEIAFASGFSNLSHFNSLFKKRWSMSPRELRKILQK